MARDRSAGSAIEENADGGCKVMLEACAEGRTGCITRMKTNNARQLVKRIAAVSLIDGNNSSRLQKFNPPLIWIRGASFRAPPHGHVCQRLVLASLQPWKRQPSLSR